MKRFYILLILAGLVPMTTIAQDDLYFTPKKSAQTTNVTSSTDDQPAYYSGISKDESEYNRRNRLSSYYQKIGQDSLGNDIIEFHSGDGTYGGTLERDTIYPGSEQYVFNSDDDFAYSRRMGRFDNFYGWYNPVYYSYWGPWGYSGFYDPWFYGASWRYGWGWYGGFYDPWFYGSWGWPYRSWYYGGWPYYAGYHHALPLFGRADVHTGTRNHSFGRNLGRNFDRGMNASRATNGTFGKGTRPFNTQNSRSYNNLNSDNSGFRGTRSYNPNQNTQTRQPQMNAPMRSNSSSFGSGSRSFGGSRSMGGGGSFGGGRSGGGGHFGGRR